MAEKTGIEFEIHIDRGDVTGKCWDGKFRAKEMLSYADRLRRDRIRRDLLGPGSLESADPEAVAVATMLAELQVSLTDAPEWWAGGVNHSDENLLGAVWTEVNKIRQKHQDDVIKAGEEAKKKLQEIAK